MDSGISFGDSDIKTFNKGGLLIGTWFFAISWGSLVRQVYTYFRSFPNDPAPLRIWLGFLFLNETAGLCLFFYATYHQIIDLFGKPFEAMWPGIVLSSLPVTSGLTIFGVNLFLIWRYHRLTKRLWLSGALVATAFAAYGCILWATSLNVKLVKAAAALDIPYILSLMDTAKVAAKAGLSMEVTIISSITLLLLGHLLWYLKRDMQDTRRILHRLILVTVESGMTATALAVANLVYHLRYPPRPISSSWYVTFQTAMDEPWLIALRPVQAGCTGRIYLMGMLFNLNTRGDGGFVMRDSAGSNRPSSVRPSGFALSPFRASDAGHYSNNTGTVSIKVETDIAEEVLNDNRAVGYRGDAEKGSEKAIGRKASIASSYA